jgi:hypothetical protein
MWDTAPKLGTMQVHCGTKQSQARDNVVPADLNPQNWQTYCGTMQVHCGTSVPFSEHCGPPVGTSSAVGQTKQSQARDNVVPADLNPQNPQNWQTYCGTSVPFSGQCGPPAGTSSRCGTDKAVPSQGQCSPQNSITATAENTIKPQDILGNSDVRALGWERVGQHHSSTKSSRSQLPHRVEGRSPR